MATITVKITETSDIVEVLNWIPVELREKSLKKAVRKAALLMAREARRRAPVGDDDIAKKNGGRPLKQSIVRTAFVDGEEVVGVVKTVGFANTYAQSLEYGHQMILWGDRSREGERVPAANFWRPAIDQTLTQQKDIIVKTLREENKKLSDKRLGRA